MWPKIFTGKPKILTPEQNRLLKLESQNSYAYEQRNGIKVSVEEFEEIDGSLFGKMLEVKYPGIRWGYVFTGGDSVVEKLEDAKPGRVAKTKIHPLELTKKMGLYTTGMVPCNFIIMVTNQGIVLEHADNTRDGNNSSSTGNSLSQIKKINEPLDILVGAGRVGKESSSGLTIKQIAHAMYAAGPDRGDKIIYLSPMSQDGDEPINVAVLPVKNGESKVIISRKKTIGFQPTEIPVSFTKK